MNYKKHYDLLIEKANNRTNLEGYSEKHHIIPKCMNGFDGISNIAKLTAREHYVSHWLLHKIYPTNLKLIYALNLMTRGNRNKYFIVSSRDYERIKKLKSENLKGFNNPMWGKRGKDNPNWGKIVSIETRRKMSIAKKGKKQSKELIEKRVKKNTGKKRTKETKKKMSLSMMGKNIGKFPSKEARLKMSIAGLGRKHTPEQNLANSKRVSGKNNPMYGKTGELNPSSKKVKINNIIYNSITEAGRIFNISRKLVSYRINSTSEKYKDYKYI